MAQSTYNREEKLKYIDEYEAIYNEIIEEKSALTIADLKISGRILMDMGIKEGPVIGATLKELLNDVIDEPSHNTEEYLRDKAKEIAGNMENNDEN